MEITNVTNHAMYRYLEKIIKLDMEAWKKQYCKIRKTSRVSDGELIIWMEKRGILQQFRDNIISEIKCAVMGRDIYGKPMAIGKKTVFVMTEDYSGILTTYPKNIRHEKLLKEWEEEKNKKV